MKHQKLLHHIATGAGFAFLIGWFYVGKLLGFLDWCITLAPAEYEGAALMVGICALMAPGFFIWNAYTRLIERKLDIKGQYYEDAYYNSDEKK